ncbi:hypothetical protein SARC_04480 [Sphaeroforma arctica JP610]|uniref:Uncharacterized protein n=1 Tax=Sphaeroforma arctica JP610 TaxID=667725 RepID=A0A0L0G332_9EUKA|nr:hypothetical protein SARC_04480 [Sphaeroforma arctica JP610]KNC83264.1 hypothetical protein SARC_04480 [Sphaeroforma arctica JP610]|eukprot:XP_014157166.1 hypothetical protein SARC_04480 [Sphaeroforma arctica JP610]
MNHTGEPIDISGAVRHIVYGDQILEKGGKQDGYAIAGLVETYLRQLKKEVPAIETTILSSDNAGCYQSKELLLLLPLLNLVLNIQVVRYIHTKTQDGKGLIDAHFARGTSHYMNFIRASQRNLIKKIATPKGLSTALAWNNGIQNSIVQLARIDRDLEEIYQEKVKRLVTQCMKYFGRVNDIIYTNVECSLSGNDRYDLAKVLDSGAVITFKAFTYSNIGSGMEFTVNFATNKVTVAQAVLQDNNSRNTTINDMNVSDTKTSEEIQLDGSDKHDSEHVDDDVQDDDAPEDEADFDIDTTNRDDRDTLSRDDVPIDQIEDDVQRELNDYEAADEESEAFAPEGYNRYGSIQDDEKCITGTCVVKASTIASIVGPRSKNRKKRNAKVAADICVRRIYLVATSVRRASYLINTHEVIIRDGSSVFLEFNLSEDVVQTMRLPRGWAPRRPHGKQYGTTFIAKFDPDIRAYFERGEADSARKMQPGVMLDQLRHPGCCSLTGENEIRVLISTLMQEKKAAETRRKAEEKRQAGEVRRVSTAVACGEGPTIQSTAVPTQRARIVKFPAAYIPFIVDTVTANREVKYDMVYDSLQQRYERDGLFPVDFPSFDQVKKKVSYQKTKLKSQDKQAIM